MILQIPPNRSGEPDLAFARRALIRRGHNPGRLWYDGYCWRIECRTCAAHGGIFGFNMSGVIIDEHCDPTARERHLEQRRLAVRGARI